MVAPQKIKKLNTLAKITEKLKKEGKKIVLCHGVYDLIHPGHIRHFSSAKSLGDILVVTITADKFVKKGPGRPIFREYLRAEVLSAIETIDFVAIVDAPSAIPAIKKLKPDFYIKGPDYKNRKRYKKIPRKLDSEAMELKKIGGKIIFTEDEIVFSSSKLINDYLSVYPPRTKKYLDSMKSKYTIEYILEKLQTLKRLKILIIGDAIIDQYHYCQPLGRSSKEPIMVHQYVSEETFLGGALASANHVSSISDKVTLLSILGEKNSFEDFIIKNLKENIMPIFFMEKDKHTIVKRRYLYEFTAQKLFQISYLDEKFVTKKIEKKILLYLKKEIEKYDLVIVNDFGHGLLTGKIIKLICQKARYLGLNVQANSANYGFNVITKYPRANFVCIDDMEIRLATHDRYGELEHLIKKIYKRLKCDYMIVTKGPFGSISYAKKLGIYQSPALTENIVDRVGAGDALFAISAPLVYAKMDPELISFVGNVAGALQVQVVGNRKSVAYEDMQRFITRLLK